MKTVSGFIALLCAALDAPRRRFAQSAPTPRPAHRSAASRRIRRRS